MIYKIFRTFEYLFGRKEDIRAETSAIRNSFGEVTYQFHSWEALLTHFEESIFGLIPHKIPIRIWIPLITTPEGLPFPASPYLFAIAYDNSNIQPNSASFSYTVTGSNPVIFGTVSGGFNDNVGSLSCTYNGNSLTNLLVQPLFSTTRYPMGTFYGFPAIGSHTFTSTSSDGGQAGVASYSGVKQSGMPDASAQTSFGGLSGGSQAVTTTVDNCWIFYFVYTGSDTIVATSGATQRQGGTSNNWIGDTNGPVHPAGTNTAVFTWTSTVLSGVQGVSFAPAAAAVAALSYRALIGIGI